MNCSRIPNVYDIVTKISGFEDFTPEDVDTGVHLEKDDYELSNLDLINLTVKLKDISFWEVVLCLEEGFCLSIYG